MSYASTPSSSGYAYVMPGAPLGIPLPPGMLPMTGLPGLPGLMLPPYLGAVQVSRDQDEEDERRTIPLHGNPTNYNLNNMLYTNIVESDYYKSLYQLASFEDIVDEVYRSVKHVEPWQTGSTRVPSSAYCLLLKMFTFRLKISQMLSMLDCRDNSLLRALGFLYLRYTAAPKDLWKWFEKHLEDEEPVGDKRDLTIGRYCRMLLEDMQHFGTTLPRIPIPIERRIRVMLLVVDEKQSRFVNNSKLQALGFFCVGARVSVIYADHVTEPAWYDGVIDSEAIDGRYYSVVFSNYNGYREVIDISEMELASEVASGDDGEEGGMMERVLQSSRDSSAAVGKNYAHRPTSYKGSLALKQHNLKL